MNLRQVIRFLSTGSISSPMSCEEEQSNLILGLTDNNAIPIISDILHFTLHLLHQGPGVEGRSGKGK